MRGVKFGNYHSYDDFNLFLSSKKIEAPQPIVELLEIAGADIPLDFTEFFGDVKYKTRKLSFTFSTNAPKNEFLNIFSTVQNALNGRRLNIVLDEDPDFVYNGRISVKEWQADKNIGKITVECECNPYKLKKAPTVKSVTVESELTVKLENLRQHVVPLFNSTAEIQIVFNGNTYTVESDGEFRVPEIILKEGENELIFKGAATVTITYQEGSL